MVASSPQRKGRNEMEDTNEAPVPVSVEALLAKRAQTDSGFPEDWVPIPGLGHVHLRGLSRRETMYINKVAGGNGLKIEQITIARALLQPKMSEEDVAAWQAVAGPGELDAVTGKVMELSGKAPGAAKAVYKEFEEDPGSEFRSLSGGEAGHDGGEHAHGADSPAQ
jgi:hypothetical protein